MKRFYALIIGLSFVGLSHGQYETIDAFVKTIEIKKNDNIETIATKITANSNTDKEKLRAIFAWIAHNIEYDVKALFSGKSPSQQPLAVLKSRKAFCQGYSELFQILSEVVNIKSVVVSGYSKGYGYEERKKLDKTDHSWNAVKIDNEWYLLDVTWGSGHLNQNKKYIKELKNEYFLTNPFFFVIKHLPKDPVFQFLPCPITPEEYLKDSIEIIKIARDKKKCYSSKDTLELYYSLDSIQQKVSKALRLYRYMPTNTYEPAILISQTAYYYSAPLNDTKIDLKKKMELAYKSLKYYQMAENIIKKNRKPEGRQLYDMVKQNISNVERFIEFYKNR